MLRWTASPDLLAISKFSWSRFNQALTSAGSSVAKKSASKTSGDFFETHRIKQKFSILKYEERWSGNFRELVVKNINKADVGEYSVEAKGAKQAAKLTIVTDKSQTTSSLRSKAGP